MKNFIFLFFFIAILVAGCDKDKEGYSTTKSGLKYKFITTKSTIKPVLNDVMILHIAYYTPGDSLLFDSGLQSDSFKVVLVAPTFKGGVEEGFAMMGPGDSALFKVCADSIFEKTFHGQLPSYLKKGDQLQFRVSMKSFISRSVYDSLERVKDIESRKAEFVKIETFLTKNNMDVMPTENGVYLLTSKEGSGDIPLKGDTISALFTGRMLDGKVFDKAENRDEPFRFVAGKNEVIAGWEECIPYFKKGAVVRMVIPSDLGYGASDYGKIPGYSTLVFDVEIIDIKKGKN
ncbi:MAG: FKBP-type peptidyl-prolyl cis-trans isomerase [Bacteroidetes bacterium]|nr:FKBP-type peptidyl-prolyl cis-trans isomerase [Bacteroidota bacterium]